MKFRLLSTLFVLTTFILYFAEAWFLPSGTGLLGVQNIPGFGVPASLGPLVILSILVLKVIAIFGTAVAWRSNNRFVNNFGQGGWNQNKRIWRNLQQQQQGYDGNNNRYRRSMRKGSWVRETSDNDNDLAELHSAAFAFALEKEQDHCHRRLICDLATGKMPKTENEVILSLFDLEEDDVKEKESSVSPKEVYAKAARFGRRVGSIRACELRYRCELTGAQMDKLL